MNRKAQVAAAILIVAVAAAFGFGEDKYHDASINELRIAPRVAIATLDVLKVFKKSQKFNAAMAPIKAKLEGWNTFLPDDHQLAIDSRRVYAETFQRIEDIVIRICKVKNIGLVIRAKLDPPDVTDKSSVLEWVNRPVMYSEVPDITDEVIAELDRYDEGIKSRSAADVDGPWVDMPSPK